MATDSERRRSARRADAARADLIAHGVFPTTLRVVEDGAQLRFEMLGEHGDLVVTQRGHGRWSWIGHDGDEHCADTTRDLVRATGATRLTWRPRRSGGQ